MSEGRTPFSPVVVLSLVLAAVFCLGAVAVLSAYAPELRTGNDGRGHALSKSAIGYAGLVRLLEATGRPVLLSRGRPVADQEALVILTPDSPAPPEQIDPLLSGRSVLIVLPKWQVGPSPTREGWVRRVETMPPPLSAAVLPDDLPALTITERSDVSRVRLSAAGGRQLGVSGPITGARSLSGADWLPVLVDERGRAVVVTYPRRGIYVLAEPDLLATHGLAELTGGRLAVAVIDELSGGQPVMIDLTLAGFSRPRSLLRLFLEPPLLGFTLCLLAATLLIGWQAVIRFGPTAGSAAPFALGKRALADNTAALARLARKEHLLAPAYLEVVRRSALRRAAVPDGMATDRADALLDRLAARSGPGPTIAEFTARASRLRSADEMVALALELFKWKRDVTHGSG